MTAPQQFSPDGQWWWDGSQWVPASQAPSAQPTQPQPAPPYGQPYGQPFGQPYGPPYGYPAYASPPPQRGTDGKAVGSLVASLIWLCGIGSVVAVVLGHLSRSEARKQGREPAGLALAGLVLGYLGIAATALGVVAVVAFKEDIGHAFDASVELQSAAEAEHSYHDANGRYTATVEELRPFGYINIHGRIDVTVISVTDSTFCLSAESLGEVRYVSEHNSSPTTTPCH